MKSRYPLPKMFSTLFKAFGPRFGVMNLRITYFRPVVVVIWSFISLVTSTTISAAPIVLTPSRDIWTTSVYSYAPSGGGPGGGLNDGLLRVGGWGDEYRSLLQFSLIGAPTNASSAILRLYDISANSGTPVSMYVDRITSSWDWTIQPITSLSPDNERLWWENRPSFVQVSTSPLLAPTVGNYYDIDLTNLYNQWQSGAVSNYGVQLRPTSTNNEFNVFASSENATATWRPQLIVVESKEILVCHVDNVAGKIDLILVAAKANHLGNPSHTYGGISDYGPIAMGASGIGKEDTDGNGVDDGCEIPNTCPCWAQAQLQAVTAANFEPSLSCDGLFAPNYPAVAAILDSSYTFIFLAEIHRSGPYCADFRLIDIPISTEEAEVCIAQIAQRCADIGQPIIPD